MQSKSATVADYLESLIADRRAPIEALRKVIVANLGPDFEEGMQYGMIGYYIPHTVFPAGYHCDPKQPLPYAGIASQKQGISLYLMALYIGGGDGGDETPDARWFRAAWTATGKKLDMGKSCIRFKKIEDVPLEVVGEAIRRIPAKRYIERYTAVLAESDQRKAAAKATAKAGKAKAAPTKSKSAKSA